MRIRRRLPDGSFGPLEDAFPGQTQLTQNERILLEAVAGLQEQVIQLQEELAELKGGAE